MNVTLSIPEEILVNSRRVAQQQGLSLNEMIRRYLASVASRVPADQVAGELQELWKAHPGHSGGRRFSREDAYEGRL